MAAERHTLPGAAGCGGVVGAALFLPRAGTAPRMPPSTSTVSASSQPTRPRHTPHHTTRPCTGTAAPHAATGLVASHSGRWSLKAQDMVVWEVCVYVCMCGGNGRCMCRRWSAVCLCVLVDVHSRGTWHAPAALTRPRDADLRVRPSACPHHLDRAVCRARALPAPCQPHAAELPAPDDADSLESLPSNLQWGQWARWDVCELPCLCVKRIFRASIRLGLAQAEGLHRMTVTKQHTHTYTRAYTCTLLESIP